MHHVTYVQHSHVFYRAALHVESSDTFEIVDCNSSTKQKDSAKCGVPEINHTCDSGTESSGERLSEVCL